VIFGFIINLSLGAIYAYSVISVPLAKYFRSLGLNPSATEMQLPFIVFLALANIVVMPLAGRIIDIWGPRIPVVLGGIATGLAWIGASLSTSPLMLTILYGVFGGVGLGLAYNAPISTIGRWFPDRRGLALGIALAGFGLSAAITGPLLDYLISTHGLQRSFQIVGLSFTIIIVGFGLLLRFPEMEAIGQAVSRRGVEAARDYTLQEAVKTRVFWVIWTCFAIGTLAGLLAIGVAKPVGLEVAAKSGLGETEASALMTALIVPFAASNACGRPLFGWIVDKLGTRKAITLSYTLIFIASTTLYLYPTIPVYIASFAVLWLNLGAWLAIAPAATTRTFGITHSGEIYGSMLSAYGVGAITGNLLAGRAKDILGYYTAAMPVVAALAIIGVIIAQTRLEASDK